jgi:hypothetical protein
MNIPILSFNSGLISPKADKRTDIEKHSSGCRVLENMIPLIYGPAERRPGTMYVNTALGKANMVDFIYSSSIAYQVEFTALKARFYYDGALLLDDDDDPVEITTPYIEDDLFSLQFHQSNDVMWITHQNYPPSKLSRLTATSFSLDEIEFTKGPFLKRHDLDLINGNDDITLTPSVTTGTGTLTASDDIFEDGHIGALFKLTMPRVVTEVTLAITGAGSSSSIPIKGAFSFDTTGGPWSGTIRIERQEDGTNWETYRTYVNQGSNIQASFTEKDDDIVYRITLVSLTSGTGSATLRINDSTQNGICRITAVNSATEAEITVITDFAYKTSDGDKGITNRWYEGSWSDVRGYPRAFNFFGGRVIYGGSIFEPQRLWLSLVDDYENFEAGVNDADSFAITIDAGDRDAIQWIASSNSVLIGTSGSEYRLRSTSYDSPITPTNYTIRRQTTRGCAPIQTILAGDAVLFVDFVNKKIREMTFNYEKDKYLALDMNSLAEHITKDRTIVDWAYQKNPDPIIWCVFSDGVIASMTYEREQNVIAWSEHPLGGDGFAESFCVTPADNEDVITLCVKRTINGSEVHYVEQMQPRYWGADKKDCFFVDCGLIYNGVATTTLTGLDHLEGKTVKINGNGAEFPDRVVLGGQISLPEEVTYAIVGLSYTYKLSPVSLEVPSRDGAMHGTIKKVAEVSISFLDTLGVQYGVDEDHLFDIDFRTTEPYSSPPNLFTGDKVVNINGGFDIDTNILITGNGIYPCTVKAILPRVSITGR